jgi:hypothetical protein
MLMFQFVWNWSTKARHQITEHTQANHMAMKELLHVHFRLSNKSFIFIRGTILQILNYEYLKVGRTGQWPDIFFVTRKKGILL